MNDNRVQLGTEQRIVFSDESRFCLEAHDGRMRVRQRIGERLSPTVIVERHTTSNRSVMVWSAITYHNRTPLVLLHIPFGQQR